MQTTRHVLDLPTKLLKCMNEQYMGLLTQLIFGYITAYSLLVHMEIQRPSEGIAFCFYCICAFPGVPLQFLVTWT